MDKGKKEVILVIDTGSSSMKGFLFDKCGSCLESCRVFYRMKIRGKAATQTPEDFRQALFQIGKKLAGEAKENELEITALAFTSQRSSLVCIDTQGETPADIMMWYDKRTEELCRHKKKLFGDRTYEICGIEVNPVLLAPKIEWINIHEPAIAAQTAKYMCIHDYLIFLTTGEMVTDPTLACRSGLMDIHTEKWSQEMLELYGIDEAFLCTIIPAGSQAGRVTKTFSRITGLREGTPVITAGGDQQCSAVGQGLDKYTAGITLGSGGYILQPIDHLVWNKEKKNKISATAEKGCWNLELSVPSVGTSYDWCRRNFGREGASQGEFTKILENSGPGAGGILALMDLNGHSILNPEQGGNAVYCNIGLATEKSDFARASVESLMDSVAQKCRQLEEILGSTRRIIVTGGMSESDLINQMLADMLGISIFKSGIKETTAMGAWKIAAVNMGLYSSIEEVNKINAGMEKEYCPDSHVMKIYEKNRKLRTILKNRIGCDEGIGNREDE